MSLLQSLVDQAFHRAAPADANLAIDEARNARGPHSVSYEVALPALDPDEFLRNRTLARLTAFLDSRGVKPPDSGDVFVSLFTPQGLYFVDAGPVVQTLANARALTLAEVMRRYGQDGVGDPPLLGT